MPIFSKLGVGTLVAGLLAGGAVAAETLVCQQTRISKGGFTTLSAAQSFFPESERYEISGDRVRSDYYGNGYVTNKGGRKILTFPVELSDGTVIDIRLTWKQSNGRYSVRFASGAGYEQIKGAGGVCEQR